MSSITVYPAPDLWNASKNPTDAIVLTYDSIKDHYISPLYYLSPTFYESGAGTYDYANLGLVIEDQYKPDFTFLDPVTHIAKYIVGWQVQANDISNFLYAFILSTDKPILTVTFEIYFTVESFSGGAGFPDPKAYSYPIKFNP